MSPSLPRLARLIAPVALGVATLVLAASPTALAGTVEVRSCGDAPTGGVDNAWQPITDNLAGYEVPTAACPPTSTAIGTDLDHPQILGRSVWTKLMSGVAPTAGDGAQMRLTAPAGTVITAVSLKRDLGKRNDGYALYGKTASGAVLDNSCAIPGGQAVCYVGGSGTAPQTFSALTRRGSPGALSVVTSDTHRATPARLSTKPGRTSTPRPSRSQTTRPPQASRPQAR